LNTTTPPSEGQAPACAKRGRGRPSTFSATTAERLLEHVRLGFSTAKAARAVGVSDQTVRNWRERFPEFAMAYHAALEHAENRRKAARLG